SSSISKLPQVVRSEGTGCAASHLPFTNAFRSSQASAVVSRSASAKAAVGGNSAAVVAGLSGASAEVAGWSLLQPARAAATARDSSSTEGVLVIGEPQWAGMPPTLSRGGGGEGVSEVTRPGGRA